MQKWHLKLISRLLTATVCYSVTTCRKNIEQVLYELHWLNVPCSLKIPSSFADGSTIKRLTERNFPRRMPPTQN
jgi:hypothetical protein